MFPYRAPIVLSPPTFGAIRPALAHRTETEGVAVWESTHPTTVTGFRAEQLVQGLPERAGSGGGVGRRGASPRGAQTSR